MFTQMTLRTEDATKSLSVRVTIIPGRPLLALQPLTVTQLTRGERKAQERPEIAM